MTSIEQVERHFQDSIALNQRISSELPQQIALGAERLCDALVSGNKILSCGIGGSAATSQVFTSQMINRYELERPALPAIALGVDSPTLTSVSGDYGQHQVFSRQIRALGQHGDILLAFTSSGNSESIADALRAAQSRDMSCLALTGHNGGELAGMLSERDLEIRVPSQITAHIDEAHLTIAHCLCNLIDNALFRVGYSG